MRSLSINCESCHGPGRRHVTLAASGLIDDSPDIGIRALGSLTKDASLEVCFQCHAIKTLLQPDYLPGKPFEVHYSLKLPILASDPYLPDGRLRIFGYQLNHLASECYLSGSMTCVDCHDPHSSSYRTVTGDPLDDRFSDGQCTGCHPSKADDIMRHTRHRPDSPGSRCVACHMPYRQQPGVGNQIRYARSDHTIAIPRPGVDESLGVVNACSICHADVSPVTLSNQAAAWYGRMKPHRDLVRGLARADSAASAVQADDLIRPEERDPIAQVAALGRFVREFVPTEGLGVDSGVRAALRELRESDDTDVRAVALAVLHLTQAQQSDALYINQALRASEPEAELVRYRWVSALVVFAAEFAERGDLAAATRTLHKALDVIPGHAVALYELALLHMRARDWASAESTLVRTLESAEQSPTNRWMVEPNRGIMLVNLGLTRDRLGLESAAAATYRQAIESDPGEAFAYYYLATHHHNQGDLEVAASLYRQAVVLKPDLKDAYLLMAGALRDLGRIDDAIAAVNDLLRIDPPHTEARALRDQLLRLRR